MPSVAGPPLEKIAAPDFDLDKTLNSGQVFHWTAHGPGFAGTINETPVYVEQRGAELWVTPGQGAQVRRHFALDHPMTDIIASFPGDEVLRAAIEFSRGIRIIRQPAWECLATFLTSALKQVPHIRAVSLAIRRRFGRHLRLDGGQEAARRPGAIDGGEFVRAHRGEDAAAATEDAGYNSPGDDEQSGHDPEIGCE